MATDPTDNIIITDNVDDDEEFFDIDNFEDGESEPDVIEEIPGDSHPDDCNDVFEIQDFTCATAWERLISSISKALKLWGVNDGIEDVEDKWLDQMEDLDDAVNIHYSQGRLLSMDVGEHPYNVVLEYRYITHRAGQRSKRKENPQMREYCKSMCELVSRERDHTVNAPVLSRWFGLTRYLVLNMKGCQKLDHETCSFLLSSMNLATSQVGCTLAYFVPLDSEKGIYQGSLQCNQYRMNFRTWQQRKEPVTCNHLSGILDVFNRNLNQYSSETTPVMPRIEKAKISATFTYVKPCKITKSEWKEFLEEKHGLEWGPENCPLKHLHLHTTWPFFQEGKYHDHAYYSSLEPDNAPKWIISAEWANFSVKDRDSMSQAPLARAANKVLRLALDADPNERWENFIPQPFSTYSDESDEDNPIPVLGKSAINKTPTIEEHIRNLFRNVESKPIIEKDPPISNPKTVPYGTLLSWFILEIFDLPRLSMLNIGCAWREFVAQVGKHWHRNKLLPYISGVPDLKCCLLHQKLQLLNECIYRKKKEDDEWVDDLEKDLDTNPNIEPEGVEKHLEGYFLLNDPETLINVPLTLEQPMYTADILQERFTTLQDLGTSMEASKKRAELQNAQLISDIAGFKAANPKGVLEDFIRWYSPNDWISDKDDDAPKGQSRDGKLSIRMEAKDNIWQILWKETKPCVASRQKPLFDFNEEGEQVLRWLETLSPMQTLIQLSQVGIGTAISVLSHSIGYERNVDPLVQQVERICLSARKTWRWDDQNDMHFFDLNRAMAWCRDFGETELACSRTAALIHYFEDECCSRLVDFLLRPPHILQVVTEKERAWIRNLYIEENEQFPSPRDKQFTLLKNHPRPHLGNRHVPNRLYAFVGPSKFCLATAFGMSYD